MLGLAELEPSVSIELDRFWWISCDRSGEDGINCVKYGAATIPLAEEMCFANDWISYDGYHECPRHKGNSIERFQVPRAGTYIFEDRPDLFDHPKRIRLAD